VPSSKDEAGIDDDVCVPGSNAGLVLIYREWEEVCSIPKHVHFTSHHLALTMVVNASWLSYFI
jgi:hypothetical protein